MDLFTFSKQNSNDQFLMQSMIKDAQTYNKIKDFYDYLDYHKDALIRDYQLQPAGLRNLGNTCYLNVLLQVVFHVNYLRDKICLIDAPSDKFLQALRILFGSMARSKFIFADPSDVFGSLISAYPDVFGPGIQNDFQQVFTLLIDQLQKSFAKISQEDNRSLQKIFYGKITVDTIADKKYTRTSKFSVINLDVKQDSFEKALQVFKTYQIDEFNTLKGSTMKALSKTTFVQTPAIMTFFINRVSFENGELAKDSRAFEFERKIYFAKKNAKNTHNAQQKISNFEKQKSDIQRWILKITENKNLLQKTINYLESTQFNEIKNPTIINPLGQNALKASKEYLIAQIKQIENKIVQSKQNIEKIKMQKDSLQLEHDSQIYTIFAVMIHQGKSAQSGHYKVCINTKDDKWIQFNDKKVSEVSYQKIQQYKNKGQICCLFYRRTTLVCNGGKTSISATLKKQISQKDELLKQNIDKARISQTIYNATQTAGLLVQSQWQNASNNLPYYFLKPNLNLICEGKSFQACKKAILWQTLYNQQFQKQLKYKLFDQKIPINLPSIQLDLPAEYKDISNKIKNILILERQLLKVPKAFQQLQKLAHINPKNQLIEDQLVSAIGILFMKGVFYYEMFIQYNFYLESKSLNKTLNNIMNNMNNKTQFLFSYVPIISSLNEKFQKLDKQNKNLTEIVKKASIKKTSQLNMSTYTDLFSRRFAVWIKRAQNVGSIHQGIVNNDKKMHGQYLQFSTSQ